MGFNIKISSYDRDNVIYIERIKNLLVDAETNGHTLIDENIELSHGVSIKDNQIFHYKPSNKSEQLYPKKAWKLVSFIKIDNKGQKYNIKFEAISDDYLKKGKIISNEELTEIRRDWINGGVTIGAFYLHESGRYYNVCDITTRKTINGDLSYDTIFNPHRININMDEPVIKIKYEKDSFYPEEFDKEELITKKEFDELNLIKLNESSLGGYESKIKMFIESGDISSLSEDVILIGSDDKSVDVDNGLVHMGSTKHYELMRDKMAISKDNATLYSRSTRRSIMLKTNEMQKKISEEMAKFDGIKNLLAVSVAELSTKINKINKLIQTIEIFAGINEDIVQIAVGQDAPDTQEICLRQMKLFMDEEIAIYENEGLELKDLPEFDLWAGKSENYTKLVPDEKCVVIMGLRRNSKKREHIENAFERAMLADMDDKTYIMIRNGGNVYRIFTDHIGSNRLFPKKEELQQLFENISSSQQKITGDDYNSKTALQELENSDGKLFSYKKNFLLLHGIISRTNIFNVSSEFNIMNVEQHKGVVQMIYDEENVLSDGKPTFKEWLKCINKDIKVGSRIYYSSENMDGSAEDNSDRFTKYWSNKWSAPRMPYSSVYFVKPIKKTRRVEYVKWVTEEEKYKLLKGNMDGIRLMDKTKEVDGKLLTKINYSDKNGMWSYEESYTEMSISFNESSGETRKGKDKYRYYAEELGIKKDYNGDTWTRFKIFNDDNFVINYDALVLEEIDYYITSRLHRKHYLNMLPILIGLRDALIEEIKVEKHFIENYKFTIMKKTGIGEKDCEIAIKEAIDYWKNTLNVVIKRPFDPTINKNINSVELQTMRILKKRFKLKKLDVSNNSAGKTLIVQVEARSWDQVERVYKYYKANCFAKGLSKSKFVEAIYKKLFGNQDREKRLIDGVLFTNYDNENSKARLKRDMVETDDKRFTDKTDKNEGVLFVEIVNDCNK